MIKKIFKRTRHLEKGIFASGEYIDHFKPDAKHNPFSGIYRQKKQDTLGIINATDNCNAILDIGGGMGRLSLALSENKKRRITLSDISVDMLKLAVNNVGNAKNLTFVNTDAHYLPYEDNSFDTIIGLDLICHLIHPEKALKEFYRVLKKEGMLIIDSTNSNPLWTLFYPRYVGKNPLNWIKVMKFHGVLPGWEKIVNHYPKETFFSFLTRGGFKIVQSINYGPSVCPKWHLAVAKKTF